MGRKKDGQQRNPQTLYKEAEQAYERGEKKRAVALLKQALLIVPDFADALGLLATILFESGHIERGCRMMLRAMRVASPDSLDPLALANFGSGLFAVHKYKEAEEVYRHAIELSPKDAGLWHALSVVQDSMGHPEDAERSVRRALELDDSESEFWRSLGIICETLGKLDDAEQAYRRAIRIDPENPYLRKHLWNLLKRMGKTKEMAFVWLHDLEESIPEEKREKYLELHEVAEDTLQKFMKINYPEWAEESDS